MSVEEYPGKVERLQAEIRSKTEKAIENDPTKEPSLIEQEAGVEAESVVS